MKVGKPTWCFGVSDKTEVPVQKEKPLHKPPRKHGGSAAKGTPKKATEHGLGPRALRKIAKAVAGEALGKPERTGPRLPTCMAFGAKRGRRPQDGGNGVPAPPSRHQRGRAPGLGSPPQAMFVSI